MLGCRRFSSLLRSLLLVSLELSDTKVYEPSIRALLGTASQFCKVVIDESSSSVNSCESSVASSNSRDASVDSHARVAARPMANPHVDISWTIRSANRKDIGLILAHETLDSRNGSNSRDANVDGRARGVPLFFVITLEPRVE